MEEVPINKTENMDTKLTEIVTKIESVCNPESIFLYGSRARGDYAENSDFEIGVVLTEENYVGRSKLKEAVGDNDVSVFPFRLADLESENPDTPFNKHVYLRELKETARTLGGAQVIENLNIPEITDIDLVSDAQFNLGMALSAVLVERSGDKETASPMFYKSCLFAARALLMKKTGNFPKTYSEIAESAQALEMEKEYRELISNAILARRGERIPDTLDLYRNISFINQVVVPSLTEDIKTQVII